MRRSANRSCIWSKARSMRGRSTANRSASSGSRRAERGVDLGRVRALGGGPTRPSRSPRPTARSTPASRRARRRRSPPAPGCARAWRRRAPSSTTHQRARPAPPARTARGGRARRAPRPRSWSCHGPSRGMAALRSMRMRPTTSSMSSSRSLKWRYSAIGVSPTEFATRAMVSGSSGASRSNATAASTICSRLARGGRPRRGGGRAGGGRHAFRASGGHCPPRDFVIGVHIRLHNSECRTSKRHSCPGGSEARESSTSGRRVRVGILRGIGGARHLHRSAQAPPTRSPPPPRSVSPRPRSASR